MQIVKNVDGNYQSLDDKDVSAVQGDTRQTANYNKCAGVIGS
jgi:hypothetical protein